jgi:hypothetical protein
MADIKETESDSQIVKIEHTFNAPLAPDAQKALIKWRTMVAENNFSDLPLIIAADAVISTPVEWHSYPGRDLVCLLLRTAAGVYEDFNYQNEFANGEHAVLEFKAHIGNVQVKGVHIIHFNKVGEFVNIEKILRPAEGVKMLGNAMGSKIGPQVKAALLKMETVDKNKLLTAIREPLSKLLDLMSSLNENKVNIVPYKDSWTAAMLFRHVTKSINSMADAMGREAKPAARDADEKIPELKKTFLDFSIKMKSPDFIVPEDGPYEKQPITEELSNSFEILKERTINANLTDIVDGLPIGQITKLEILHFVLYHTQRHVHQMKKICDALKNSQDGSDC